MKIYIIEQKSPWGNWQPLFEEDCIDKVKKDLEPTLQELLDLEPEIEFRIACYERGGD